MARVAVALGGAAIGFLLGGPAGAALGWTVGTLIGTLLFPPPPVKGPRLEDLTVQVSAYGVPIPKIWGWYRASGNVIWATDLVEKKQEDKASGNSGGPTSITYSYFGNFSVVICEGQAQPYRIWADSKLIWGRRSPTFGSETPIFGVQGGASNNTEITSQYTSYISWASGTEDELPSPMHERYDGVGNVPAYRGYMRIDFDMLPLKNFGNRIPNISVEVFAGKGCDDSTISFQYIPYANYDIWQTWFENVVQIFWYPVVSEAIDYDRNVIYQPIPTGEGTWSLLTLDMTTMTEIRRVACTDVHTILADMQMDIPFYTHPYDIGYAINFFNLLPIPNTDWLFVAAYADWAPEHPFAENFNGPVVYFTVNVITGVIADWTDPSADYPATLDTYEDPPRMSSNGWHPADPLWAMNVYIGAPKSVVVLAITEDGFGDNLEGAAIGIILVNHSDGQMSLFKWGDFGFKSAPNQYGESFSEFMGKGLVDLTGCEFYDAHPKFTDTDYYQRMYVYKYRLHLNETLDLEIEENLVNLFRPVAAADGSEAWMGHYWNGQSIPSLFDPARGVILLVYDMFSIGIDMLPLERRGSRYATIPINGDPFTEYDVPTDTPIFTQGNMVDGLSYNDFPPFWNTSDSYLPLYGRESIESNISSDVLYVLNPRTLLLEVWLHHMSDLATLTGYQSELGANLGAGTWFDHPNCRIIDGNNFIYVKSDGSRDPDQQYLPLWTIFWLGGGTNIPFLRDIVSEICTRCRMVGGVDYEVDQLGDQRVLGYSVTRQISGRNSIEPLQQVYFFDGIETDGKLIFKYRDSSSIMTIEENDLGTVPFGSQRTDKLLDVRTQELELPYRVVVRYPDPYRDYQPNSQAGMRHRNAQHSDQELTVDVPVVLTPDDAKQTAIKNLYLAWQQRTTYELSLPRSYINLDPGEVITVPYRNIVVTVYITEINMGGDAIIKLKGVSHDEVLYQDTADRGIPSPVPPPVIKGTSPMVFTFIDGPLLRDSFDPFSGFLIAAEGEDPDLVFPGGILFKASDAETYVQAAQIDEEAIIGTILTNLPPHSHTYLDRENTVRVQINRGSLSPVSFKAMMNGGNLCIIGNELCAFMKATHVSYGVFDISYLRRGIQGTEWASDTHLIGDRFLLLRVAFLSPVPIDVAEVGLVRQWKGVTYGQSIDDAVAHDFAAQNLHQKPIAPAHLRATKDGDDFVITWIRRARKDHEWKDGTDDAPLDEPYERYVLKVFDGSDIIRTVTINSNTSFLYTGAMQTTDFGSPQDAIKVKVCEVSSRVGNGYFITRWLGDSTIDLGA